MIQNLTPNLKKNEDTSEVEVVTEKVEVRRLIVVEDDFVDAVVGVENQLEVHVSDDAAHEAAVRLARENVEAELIRQALLVEAVVREQAMIEETKAIIAAPEQEAKIIQFVPKPIETSESVVVDGVKLEVTDVEVVEPLESQGLENTAEIIYSDDYRTQSELSEDTIGFEADETQMFIVNEDEAKLAEIIYPEAWWDKPEIEPEPLTVESFAQELRELSVPIESGVDLEDELQVELTLEMIAVNEQVADALEALVAPEKVAEAQDLLEEIMEAVQDFAATPEAEENLKQLCEKFFTFLKIKYDEQMVEDFVQSLLLIQEKRVATARAKQGQKIIDQGTRERDRHLQASFTQQTLFDDTQPEHLGHLALMVS